MELSHLRNFVDNQNKSDNKVSNKESNKQIEGTNNHDISNNNSSNLQANKSLAIKNQKILKIREESAETENKSLFYVELKDYFFSNFFKRKSPQLVKYEQFYTVVKDLLSIEFLLEAINEISEMKKILQPGAIEKI